MYGLQTLRTVDLADLDIITGNFLPTCVVQKMRETFPSEEYCGFKYATV